MQEKCKFIKPADGSQCKAIAAGGTEFCRHHQKAKTELAPRVEMPHFGYDDHEWEEQMAAALRHAALRNTPRPAPEAPEPTKVYSQPEQDPLFWEDYSCDEIQNYIRNATGGRVEIPGHFSHERMVAHACEVMS